MNDITNLSDADPDVRHFSNLLAKQQFALREIFEAIRRETKRVTINKRNTMKELLNSLDDSRTRLSVGSKIAIRMATHTFLRTVKLIKRMSTKHYEFYVEDVLDMMDMMLKEMPYL
eukprot:1393631-Amorphochlora_amoeboformis.AAC.1